MENGNVERIQRAYEAFGRGDIPGVLGTLADDVEWDVPEILPQGMRVRGRDAVGGFFEKVGEAWGTSLTVEPEDFVASGDRVCVIGRAHGTHDGAESGYRFVHALTLRDGAATRFEEFVYPEPGLVA
jgi:ketosteroid isomerase-like protein